jgi:hypothetical protein
LGIRWTPGASGKRHVTCRYLAIEAAALLPSAKGVANRYMLGSGTVKIEIFDAREFLRPGRPFATRRRDFLNRLAVEAS